MAVKRSRAGTAENSGWPDASYFNPASFGLATLLNQIVNPIDNKIILYDNGTTGSPAVSVEFQQRGWFVDAAVTGEAQLREKLQSDAAVLLMKYNSSSPFVTTGFYLNEIKNYIEKGRLVVIAASKDMPVDAWFPGTPAIKWSGNNQQASNPRTSTYLLPGRWQTYPNNLVTPLTKRSAPVTAFSIVDPNSTGWTVRAKMRMKDGKDQPFLLTRRIGKGMLVVTSSAFGYSGGYEMFGNNYLENVVSLVENFRAEQLAFNPNITTTAVSVSADEGACSATIALDSPAIDNGLELAALTNDHPSAIYPVGTTTVTWVATDVNGYRDQAIQLITVADKEAPMIHGMPEDIVQDNDAGKCGAVITWPLPTASDNCGIESFVGDHAPGEFFPVGTTTVTYTATDIHGNVITSNFDIIVNDKEAPAITCLPDINLSACETTATWAVPLVTDNCPDVTVTQTGGPVSGSEFASGSSTVISYEAKDASGNNSHCSFTVQRAAALSVFCSASRSSLYFGVPGDQSSTITIMPVGGKGPYKVSVTMNRPLACNVITEAGDETWIAGAGTTNSVNISCPGAVSVNALPMSVANSVQAGEAYSVTVTLMADAILTATVTDADGCTVICTTAIHAQDVRCFAGNSGQAKVELCHQTGNDKNPCVQICVEESAVAEHLAHGDYPGKCAVDCMAPAWYTQASRSATVSQPEALQAKALSAQLFPNPAAEYSTLKIQSPVNEKLSITVADVAGRVMEHRSGVAANSVLKLGSHYRPGVYVVQIVQGREKLVLRLLKMGRPSFVPVE